jgi:AcrR family transcriptional regulator
MPRQARRQREIEHTRTDILHAAARVFARLGFENATIHDIAAEAGYTAPSLYSYFGGKAEIVATLIATMQQEAATVCEAEMPAGLTFPQRLEALFGSLAEISDRWGEARMLLYQVNRSCDAAAQQAGEASFISTLVRWIEKNLTSPADLGGATPEEAAFLIRGILHGASLLGQRDRFRSPAGRRFALALQVCLYGLGGASTPPSEKRPRVR